MKDHGTTGPDFKKGSRKDLKAEYETLAALVQEHQTKRRKHKQQREVAEYNAAHHKKLRDEALDLLADWINVYPATGTIQCATETILEESGLFAKDHYGNWKRVVVS